MGYANFFASIGFEFKHFPRLPLARVLFVNSCTAPHMENKFQNTNTKIGVAANHATQNRTTEAILQDVFTQIKAGQGLDNGDITRLIGEIRTKADKGEDVRGLKAGLPTITFAGFSPTNKKQELYKSRNGLICIDVDKLTKDELPKVRTEIQNDPHTLACFLSPSGNGLKIIARLADPDGAWIDNYLMAESYYASKHGLTIDPQCKNINRLCYFSYDPEIHINENATPLPKCKTKAKKTDPIPTDTELQEKIVKIWEAEGLHRSGSRQQGTIDLVHDEASSERSVSVFPTGVSYIWSDTVSGSQLAQGNDTIPPQVLIMRSGEFIEDLTKSIDCYSHGSKYYIRKDDRYLELNESSLKRQLCVKHDVKKTALPEMNYSPMDAALAHIESENVVEIAAECAGLSLGLHNVDGNKILVTREKKPPFPQEGDCEMIKSYYEKLLGEDQIHYLYGWLQHYVNCLNTSKRMPGQVLAIVGPVNVGKTFFIETLKWITGQSNTDPTKYLTNSTDFNDSWISNSLLTLDDVAVGAKARRGDITTRMKNTLYAGKVSIHRKGLAEISIPLIHRIVIACNEDSESYRIIPTIDSGFHDKLICLKAYEGAVPMPDAEVDERATAFQVQVPAFLNFLLHEYELPEEYKGQPRTLVKGYVHPDFEEMTIECSWAYRFGRLLVKVIHEDGTYTPEKIRAHLSSNLEARTDYVELTNDTENKTGRLLSDLARQPNICERLGISLVKRRSSRGVEYDFKHVQGDDEEEALELPDELNVA
jgi:hypothetical protein